MADGIKIDKTGQFWHICRLKVSNLPAFFMNYLISVDMYIYIHKSTTAMFLFEQHLTNSKHGLLVIFSKQLIHHYTMERNIKILQLSDFLIFFAQLIVGLM